MKRLLIMRHGDAENTSPNGIDSGRPLSQHGMQDVARQAQNVGSASIDRVVTSSAQRARQTAECFVEHAGLNKSCINTTSRIYRADGAKLVRVVKGFEAAWETVLLVGHMPGIALLSGWLVKDLSTARDHFPTAALVDIALNVESWESVSKHCGTLQRMNTV